MSESISETAPLLEPSQPESTESISVPTPNDPPWRSWPAVGVWFLSVCLIAVVPAIFLAPYALTRNAELSDGSDLINALSTDPTAIALQVGAIIPAHLLTIALAWLVVTNARTYSFFKTLGWRSGGMKWWHYVVILGGFLGLAIVVGTVFPEQETQLTRILKSSRYIVFLVAFMATFTAPLVEEVIYRGILYSALQRSLGVRSAVGIVTFLFALVHVPQYYESVSTMFLLTLLSLVLTLVRVRTDNLLPCVILHTIFNGFQSMLLIAEPYLKLESTAEDAVSAFFFAIK